MSSFICVKKFDVVMHIVRRESKGLLGMPLKSMRPSKFPFFVHLLSLQMLSSKDEKY